MRLLDWFKGSKPKVSVVAAMGTGSLFQVSGTTTNSKEAAVALVKGHELPDREPLYLSGTLRREPGNAHDPKAVAVLVGDDRIGYLPGYAANNLSLRVGSSLPVALQLFSADLGTHIRVEAFVWLGGGAPQWAHNAENPPAMSSQQKDLAAHKARSGMVREALAEGGRRAQEFKAGMVNGVHYLELIEPIKQLKREGDLEGALALCYIAIEGAEGDCDERAPAPAYTEHAAIIHRKLGQKQEEVDVLERWLDFVPVEERGDTWAEKRLAKIPR